MNEPTQPTDEALFNALKDLIVEAQAVADDHHRPRYARLDQALASARNALLGYWATPQPTQAQAGAVPLTNAQLQEISLNYSDSEDECTGFRDGWRAAEKHYGIKGGQHGAE